jgi:hypothetical protein
MNFVSELSMVDKKCNNAQPRLIFPEVFAVAAEWLQSGAVRHRET